MGTFQKAIAVLALALSALAASCATYSYTQVALDEIKPLPRAVVVAIEKEYEPIYAVFSVLEISEENGVQKSLFAKNNSNSPEIKVGASGDISASEAFDSVIGTFKIASLQGSYINCSVESLSRKIPNKSYIRVQIGQREKAPE